MSDEIIPREDVLKALHQSLLAAGPVQEFTDDEAVMLLARFVITGGYELLRGPSGRGLLWWMANTLDPWIVTGIYRETVSEMRKTVMRQRAERN